MITALIAKLPMRDKETTKGFYCEKLGFQEWGNMSYSHYLMLVKEGLELHLFEFKELDVLDNYGQLYIRCRDIDQLYSPGE